MPHSLHSLRPLILAVVTALSGILSPANLLGQSVRSHPLADSAAVARERYREAVGQYRSGDLRAALGTAQLASAAWPSQPAYLGLVAQLAAQLHDTAQVVLALTRLADLGTAYPVERDPALAGLRNMAGVRRALERMAAVTAPLPTSLHAATIGPPDFFAEGIAMGPDGSIYVGSIRHGRILRRRPDGSTTDLLSGQDSLWAVSGLAIAPDSQSLWATSNAIPQMAGFDSTKDGGAELVQVALDGSGVIARHPVGRDVGGAMLGDLLVGPGGEVYASDTRGQAIWRLATRGSAPEIIARHPLLRSPQGLVMAADETTLIVADYSHGLLRIDPGTGSVSPLESPGGVTMLGIDGLARHGRDLIAIQNGGVVPRVIRIRLDPGERAIVGIEVLDRNVAIADEPTLGVVVGDQFYYVANSQWEKRDEGGTPRPGAALAPTIVLRLPLRAGPPRR